ncbi:hypothetical protein V6N12_045663 [Hibiscus sabdariffa]|uniref:Secreted protein n=1 Tax=Hibiscus sabdariffa TaxID=183260 RepID=A0ABR2G3F2_9ROSI
MTLSVVWSLPPFGGGTVMYCSKSAWPPIGFFSWHFPWHRVVCASPHHHAVTTGEAPMRVGNSSLAVIAAVIPRQE